MAGSAVDLSPGGSAGCAAGGEALGDASEAFGSGTAVLTECTFASPAEMSSMRDNRPWGCGTGAAGRAAVSAEHGTGASVETDSLSACVDGSSVAARGGRR